MTYQVEFTKAASKQFKNLSSDVQVRLRPAIDALSQEPRPDGVSKLQGSKDFYRIRVGDYRVIYQIQDKQLVVLVVTVGHRREVYRADL